MYRRTLAAVFVIFAAVMFVSALLLVVPMWQTEEYSPTLFLRAFIYGTAGVALSIFAVREIHLYKQGK